MRLFLCGAALFVATAAFAGQQPASPAPIAGTVAPGQAQVEAGCTGCHDLAVVADKHYSRTRWDEVVQDMIGRGAPIDEADRGAVVDYLATHHGGAK